MPHPLAVEGADTAAAHADRVIPEWSEQAFDLFTGYGQAAKTFTTEAARCAAESAGLPKPPDKRAWGHVALRAKRAGLIAHVGYTAASDPKVHGNTVSVWGWAK